MNYLDISFLDKQLILDASQGTLHIWNLFLSLTDIEARLYHQELQTLKAWGSGLCLVSHSEPYLFK